MVPNIILKCLIAFLGFINTTQLKAEEQQKINLSVGESRTLQIEKAIKVHVSRKGIVHLVHERDDLWNMTALRSGMVAIDVKAADQGSRTIYVQVTPKIAHSKITSRHTQTGSSPCPTSRSDSQYEVRTTVEMVSQVNAKDTGNGLTTALRWTPEITTSHVSIDANISASAQDRKIIGDPIITANPCVDIEIHAGGEEQIESRLDSNSTLSAWKLHGLAIHLQVIPLAASRVRIPYRVSLRTPAKSTGSYSLSEAKSSMDVVLGKKVIAAVVNMSSKSGERRALPLIGQIPIIGPLLTGSTDSSSLSKLIIWMEINNSTQG